MDYIGLIKQPLINVEISHSGEVMRKLMLALSSFIITASSVAYAADCEGLKSDEIRKDCEIFGRQKAIEIDQCRDEGNVAAYAYDFKTAETYSPQDTYKAVSQLNLSIQDSRVKELINEVYFGKYNKTYPLPGRLYYIVQDSCLSKIGLQNSNNYENIVKKYEASQAKKAEAASTASKTVKTTDAGKNPHNWEPLK